MKNKFLPYGYHTIDNQDIEAVVSVLQGEMLTTGPWVNRFEESLVQKTKADYAVSCSNATAALHLTAAALELKPGDKILVPTITFLSTANTARFVGADVIFSDVDPQSGLMRLEDIIKASEGFESSIKAIYPVHLAGQTVDMEEISSYARKKGWFIIEDASHAIGGYYISAGKKYVPIGNCQYSDMTVFSFHPVKTIAMGEGGAITTNSDVLKDSLHLLRCHGMTRENFKNTKNAYDIHGNKNPWYYEMQALGYNYRVSDINCALGVSQLKKLESFVEKRQQLATLYDSLLKECGDVLTPITKYSYSKPAWHLYVVLIDFDKVGLTRAQVMNQLREKNVGTQVHYIPIHMQPYYEHLYGKKELPGATAYYKKALSLPLFPSMTEEDVGYVVQNLKQILLGHK